MAILESCCCCGLAVSSAVLGVYLLVAYAIAFAIELWWILESPVGRPIPAYLLCVGYFILLTFSALLLQGLSVRRSTFLLIWLFMMGILLGPEAGLVLYLSIHYWRVTSMYGIIEVTCWGCRLVVNTISLLCVQSLYSLWREENSVLMRLETLKTQTPPCKLQKRKLGLSSVIKGQKNTSFEQKEIECKVAEENEENNSQGLLLLSQHEIFYKGEDDNDVNYIDARYSGGNEFSEFSASSFDPAVIDARLENMPYLTIRKTKHLSRKIISNCNEPQTLQKTRSLLDFRDLEFTNAKVPQSRPKAIYSRSELKNDLNEMSISGSLDRKIIKNKNLKILKKLSPFYNRKSLKINIYQINPPKDLTVSHLDSQLNKVYSSRGMYAFDEKLKKVVFYPPEVFEESMKFRKRMDSYGSSLSRSSIDTDSDDLKHISDVAL